MKSVLQYSKQYPRLFFLSLGLVVGLGMSVFSGYWAQQTIQENQRVTDQLLSISEKQIAQQTARIQTLTAENKKMKQHQNITRITNADGSSEERIISDTESSETKVTEVKAEYEHKMLQQRVKLEKKYQAELSRVTQNKLNLEIGISTTTGFDEYYYIHGSYAAFGPFILGGFVDTRPAIGVGLGINL